MMRVDTLTETAFWASLRRSAAFWRHDLGSNANNIDRYPLLSPERFVARLQEEPITADRRYAPSSFSLAEPLALVPAYRRDVWPQLQRIIDETAARALITFLPAILQLDIPVFTTLQSRAVPGASVASNNTAVATEAIRQLHADGAIATPESARVLEAALTRPGAPSIRYWYIVVPVSAPLYRSTIAPAYHDLHVMPGISIASQCAQLAQSGSDCFHPSAQYLWEAHGAQLVISSIDDRPAPLFRYPACAGSLRREPCACGAQFLLTRYA